MKHRTACLISIVCIIVSGIVLSAPPVDDPHMGDYRGVLGTNDPVVAQVIALGDNNYRASIYKKFDTRDKALAEMPGKAIDNTVVFKSESGQGVIKNGEFSGSIAGKYAGKFTMKKYVRRSPTLGKKPPKGAIVLFDGKSTGGWVHRNGKPCGWKIVDGALEVTGGKGGDILSTNVFGDHTLHVEFRTPFMPKARGQGRGNSGVYLQTRYEVQVLDSYGLEGKNNECGGIYSVSAPKVNACYPPGQWQTYDIEFSAPRFDAAGTKIKDAYITVRHNGTLIQELVSLKGVTTAGMGGELAKPRGLLLQDHGNPVQYRNIWAIVPETK
jgi:hypothetical protein